MLPLLATLLWSCEVGPAPRRGVEPVPPMPPDLLSSDAARERGRALYRDKCVLCHGERADGRGVRRWSLIPPPRDYTDPAWRAQATPSSVYVTIRDGVRGTAMPAWTALSEDEVWDLVAYVLSVAEQGP